MKVSNENRPGENQETARGELAAQEMEELLDLAVNGDRHALEELLAGVSDLVFNLSLRMLGTISDAEDASQEILIKVMTNLSAFRRESRFSTWVYRIAVNYLINSKKSMFAQRPLSFEFYGEDIRSGSADYSSELRQEVDGELLSEELKLSCTNVMLQCFDPETRCIYILGTMFRLDSRIAGELLGLTPENYRQKLSRARKKMSDFLSDYCGLSGSGTCSCKRRVDYAISQKRLDPLHLEYSGFEQNGEMRPLDQELLDACKEDMEMMDDLSAVFAGLPQYRSPAAAKEFIRKLLSTAQVRAIQSY